MQENFKLKQTSSKVEENKQAHPLEEIKIQPEKIMFAEKIKPMKKETELMQEIDKEYAGRVKELEDLFKTAKMTNMWGERATPNVDFNSFYAFL